MEVVRHVDSNGFGDSDPGIPPGWIVALALLGIAMAVVLLLVAR